MRSKGADKNAKPDPKPDNKVPSHIDRALFKVDGESSAEELRALPGLSMSCRGG